MWNRIAPDQHHQKLYVILLSLLLSLFCFRVLAQWVQAYTELAFLPPFQAWQSGAISYKFLLPTQILIIIFYGWIVWCFATKRVSPNRRQGRIFFLAGLIYVLAMVLRLTIGLAGLSQHIWFQSYLPTFFHLVLAIFLIVVGHFHLRPITEHACPKR